MGAGTVDISLKPRPQGPSGGAERRISPVPPVTEVAWGAIFRAMGFQGSLRVLALFLVDFWAFFGHQGVSTSYGDGKNLPGLPSSVRKTSDNGFQPPKTFPTVMVAK